jgi:hypothetical protein
MTENSTPKSLAVFGKIHNYARRTGRDGEVDPKPSRWLALYAKQRLVRRFSRADPHVAA